MKTKPKKAPASRPTYVPYYRRPKGIMHDLYKHVIVRVQRGAKARDVVSLLRRATPEIEEAEKIFGLVVIELRYE